MQSPGLILYIVGFALLLGPLVFFHELGHYLAARLFGIKSEVFSIGFGPEITGWTDKRGTRWKLSWIPLGGYVRFAGDMNPASQPDPAWLALPPAERARTFQAKPLWQRAIVVLAGPVTNFFLALLILMGFALNLLAAAILLVSILFYVFIYTIWLKRRTPQNIVIGGAAGAFPPLIGWAAATGDIATLPVLLFALIFLWTPPHFWALALFVKTDYAAAGVPMLPVVSGEKTTRTQIGLYTLPMIAAAVAPWLLGLTGKIYGFAAVAGSAIFLGLALQVALRTSAPGDAMAPEKRLFKYSILYLFLLFGAVIADRWYA